MKRVLALALLLAGCSEHASLERQIVQAMRDPDSAKFGPIETRKGVTCGTVNGKNAFGGYAGDIGFMARDGSLYLPTNIVCCKLHQVDTLSETMAGELKRCQAKLPEPVPLID